MKTENKKNELELNVNDEVELTITAIGSKGDGIGFFNGLAIITPNTKLKKTYTVIITKIVKNCAFAEIKE